MIDALQDAPVFTLSADGGPFLAARVISVEVVDAAGFESDQLRIVLDGGGLPIARPREGAKYRVALGYQGADLVDMGEFTFLEIERNGLEKTVTLTSNAADHTKSLKEPKTRAWSEKTVIQILQKIASEHSLKAVVDKDLGKIKIDYLAQTEESDQHFMTRLGVRIGAIISPKNGHLLASKRHSGKKASGAKMPTVTITPQRLVSDSAYKVRLKPRAQHGSVRARWREASSGKVKVVEVKGAKKGPSKTLREVFAKEAEAKAAAKAKVAELRAGEGELTLVALGMPKVRAGTNIQVAGVEIDVDGSWVASRVTHLWDYSDGAHASTTIEASFGIEGESD